MAKGSKRTLRLAGLVSSIVVLLLGASCAFELAEVLSPATDGGARVDGSSDGAGPSDAGGGDVVTSDVSPVLTFVSPADPDGGLYAARGVELTLATEPEALVYFTTDGAAPSSAGPSGSSPVTVLVTTDAGVVTVRWTAAPDPTQRTFVHVVDPDASGEERVITEGFRFTKSNSPIVVATAGEQLAASFRYQVWSQASCTGCIDEVTIGFDTAEKCVKVVNPGVYPGVSGGTSVTVTAPSSPGLHVLQVGMHQEFTCDAAVGTRPTRSENVGLVIVR